MPYNLQSTEVRESRLRDMLSVIRQLTGGGGALDIINLLENVNVEAIPPFVEAVRAAIRVAQSVDVKVPETIEAAVDAGLEIATKFALVTKYESDDEWAQTLRLLAGPSDFRGRLVTWISGLISKYTAAAESNVAGAKAAFDPWGECEQLASGGAPFAARSINIAALIDIAVMLFKLWQSLSKADPSKLATDDARPSDPPGEGSDDAE